MSSSTSETVSWNGSVPVKVIDSHTGGEPTRLVIEGAPDLGGVNMAKAKELLHQYHDDFRKAMIGEPRGNDVLVGAVLLPPSDPNCDFATVYFNNVGYLGMCGHGTIGLMATLVHLGKVSPGTYKLETPVGIVTTRVLDNHTVSLDNVPSYRYRKDVPVEVEGLGQIIGDIAWGGNWFFLVKNHGQKVSLDNVKQLTDVTCRIRQSLWDAGITGEDGGEIDHVELFADSQSGADSKNFVLCPGSAYDRSPCGTGTSAKVACLAADGMLSPGSDWVQESITGSRMTASFSPGDGENIVPTITGSAFVYGETTLLFHADDPFRLGIES